MSSFADYDVIYKGYSEGRIPNGAHLYLGLVYSLSRKTPENLHLLDLGCGTGNHVAHLLEQGLGKATIFDANTAMLEQAKSKLKVYDGTGRVVIEQHILPDVPYEDNTFDVVMSNQVFHHLKKDGDDGWNGVIKTVQQAYRVLKHNGVFIVNYSTPCQLRHGLWYSKLYPETCEKYAKRVLEPNMFLSLLREAGFCDARMVVDPLEVMFCGDRYFREDGPLDEDWRRVDSLSACVTDEELKNAAVLLTKLKSEGKLKEFMLEADEMRPRIGQSSIFYCRKK